MKAKKNFLWILQEDGRRHSRFGVEWTYDAQGRRIRQTTYTGTNNAWVVTEDLKLVSDPNLFGRHIAELNATNNALLRSYACGLDLSGSLDGAGGVGGLLMMSNLQSPIGTYFCAYDGNGNVVALVSASTGTETARYEYGPFGEAIRVTGPMAKENPFRFSTKRTCNTTDLALYEYRAYSPTLGRWLSRDPIEELAEFEVSRNELVVLRAYLNNLYVFVENHPTDTFDVLGLKPTKESGAEKLAAAALVLRPLCKKCCKCVDEKGDKWSPCHPDDCEKDALAMVSAIVRSWNLNYGNGKNTSKDNIGGYLCWDWSRAFERAANSGNSGCWNVKQGMVHKKGSTVVHFFIILNACKNTSDECTVMIDDGWFNANEFVHRAPWPPSDDWTPGTWTPPEDRYTPPPIK